MIATAPAKPTFLFVPGSAATPSLFRAIVTRLRGHGLDATAIALPSVGWRPGPPVTAEDDAVAVRAAIEALADDGRELVVVMHSYGGFPGTAAAAANSVVERRAAGKVGGVVQLVYMAALVPGPEETALDLFGSHELPAFKAVDGYLNLNPDAVAQIALKGFFGVPLPEAIDYANDFQPFSAATYTAPLKQFGYKDIPTSYVRCGLDQIVPPNLQDGFIKKIQEASAKEVKVFEIETGHIPSLSEPDRMFEILLDVGGVSSSRL